MVPIWMIYDLKKPALQKLWAFQFEWARARKEKPTSKLNIESGRKEFILPWGHVWQIEYKVELSESCLWEGRTMQTKYRIMYVHGT